MELIDLFFSTTDNGGRIRSANKVFADIAEYTPSQYTGKPHNLVRHPGTPRVVFKLLWEYLQAGKPISAYVKNKSSTGNPYWVLALAVPAGDGYLSVRLVPTSKIFEIVQSLYAELRSLEDNIEDGDATRRKDAIAASEELLVSRLASLGFSSYDDFMRTALTTEVASRESLLGDTATTIWTRPGEDESLNGILQACAGVNTFLKLMMSNIEQYEQTATTLAEKSHFVLNLAETIRLFSLNALLSAGHLKSGSAVLGAVASLMRDRSDDLAPVISTLNETTLEVISLLHELSFLIAGSKLKTEMTSVFVGELLNGEDNPHDVKRDLTLLANCVSSDVISLFATMDKIEECVNRMNSQVAQLELGLDVIRTLERNGRIEAANAAEEGAVVILFRAIGEQVMVARDEIGGFATVKSLTEWRGVAPRAIVEDELQSLAHWVETLPAFAQRATV